MTMGILHVKLTGGGEYTIRFRTLRAARLAAGLLLRGNSNIVYAYADRR